MRLPRERIHFFSSYFIAVVESPRGIPQRSRSPIPLSMTTRPKDNAQSRLGFPPPDCSSTSPLLLSHPSDGITDRLNNEFYTLYIVASHLEFVESDGARVILLIYNEPPGRPTSASSVSHITWSRSTVGHTNSISSQSARTTVTALSSS